MGLVPPFFVPTFDCNDLAKIDLVSRSCKSNKSIMKKNGTK